jgi:hypothetical protein
MEAGTYPGQSPGQPRGFARRLATETKHAFKTTEFWVYVVFLLCVLVAGTVDNSEGSQFGADNVWLYATIVTSAYLVSRGLAKSGSRDPYWDAPDPRNGDSLGERVKEAAQVLTEGPSGSTRETTADTTRMPGGSGV